MMKTSFSKEGRGSVCKPILLWDHLGGKREWKHLGSSPKPTHHLLHCDLPQKSAQGRPLNTHTPLAGLSAFTQQGKINLTSSLNKGQAAKRPLKRIVRRYKKVQGVAGHSDQQRFWTLVSKRAWFDTAKHGRKRANLVLAWLQRGQ